MRHCLSSQARRCLMHFPDSVQLSSQLGSRCRHAELQPAVIPCLQLSVRVEVHLVQRSELVREDNLGNVAGSESFVLPATL